MEDRFKKSEKTSSEDGLHDLFRVHAVGFPVFSSMLVGSMEGTLQKTTDRMGADLIVVPKEFEKSMADCPFSGGIVQFQF